MSKSFGNQVFSNLRKLNPIMRFLMLKNAILPQIIPKTENNLFSIVADAVKRDHNINVSNINTDGDATVAQDNAMASILKTTEKN